MSPRAKNKAKRTKKKSARPGAHVVLVGAGLIGSAMAAELARMPGVGWVTIVDHDTYEEKNLAAQRIGPRDVGRAKAVVQARRISRASPSTRAVAIVDRVENVPPGRLRCDAVVACLDSKAARRDVNELAWHLDVPWIDSGVDAGNGLLARVNVYIPAEGAACLECGWDSLAYDNVEVPFPCTKEADPAAPTNSPAYLGSLAASIQAAELAKLLAGDPEHLAAGKSILISARYHTVTVTKLTPNPECRFTHEIWRTRPLVQRPGQLTFGRILDLAGGSSGAVSLAVEGRPFVRLLACDACNAERPVLYVAGRRPGGDAKRCVCGGWMRPAGSDMTDSIELTNLDGRLGCRLSRAGIVVGDVLRLKDSAGRITRYEIACDA